MSSTAGKKRSRPKAPAQAEAEAEADAAVAASGSEADGPGEQDQAQGKAPAQPGKKLGAAPPQGGGAKDALRAMIHEEDTGAFSYDVYEDEMFNVAKVVYHPASGQVRTVAPNLARPRTTAHKKAPSPRPGACAHLPCIFFLSRRTLCSSGPRRRTTTTTGCSGA